MENTERETGRKARLRERKERACCRENKAGKGFGKREKAGYKSKGKDGQRTEERFALTRERNEQGGIGRERCGKVVR